VQDPTLLNQLDVFAGLASDGYVVLNTHRSFAELGLSDLLQRFRPERLITVPATDLALKHVGRAVPNVPLLGAFAAVSGLIRIESVAAAIREKFSGKVAEGNVAAATEAYALIMANKELAHA